MEPGVVVFRTRGTSLEWIASHEDAKTGARLPARELFARLKAWVEDVDWTAPGVIIFEAVARYKVAGVNVCRTYTFCVWSVIADMNSM